MLAVDWGTSSLRIYRLSGDGTIRDSRQSPKGILNLGNQSFAETLRNEAGDWISAGESPIVMSGMIGSRQGWKEAAYVSCPAGIAEIATALSIVRWQSSYAWITPGIRCRHSSGVYDVMRGEEMQIFGIAEDLGSGEHTICLPGTHSKWVVVRDKVITSFTTHMTGEVFALLKSHSILGRTMSANEHSDAAFLQGVERASDAGGLLHHLFGVRAQVLSDALKETQSAAYLSGILIGHELLASTTRAGSIHLLGTPELTRLYEIAAENIGLKSVVHNADAVATGLYSVSLRLNGES